MGRAKAEGMLAQIRQTVTRIPKGKVASYGEVARATGYPGAARQVVWALHGSRGLPWQRVVGAQGRILLRGEHALEQRLRLQSEGVAFIGERVDMKAHGLVFPRRAARRV
ncbi:MAG TPA: MGMT family protein [Terriglobales bacterium]|nr:MGMT family protein [Terriglobales bacterium]